VATASPSRRNWRRTSNWTAMATGRMSRANNATGLATTTTAATGGSRPRGRSARRTWSRWPRCRPPPARGSRNRTRHSAASRPACGCGARADPRPRSRRAAVPSRHDRPRPGSRRCLRRSGPAPGVKDASASARSRANMRTPSDVVRTSREVLLALHCCAHFQELPRFAEPSVKPSTGAPRQRLRSCAAFTEVPVGQQSRRP
jgi:hypothetical protein